jgi:hypothetical protein
VCVALFLFDFRASVAFSGSVTLFRAMASTMAASLDFVRSYLSRRDAKALLFVSRSACPENPLSLQEQLLAMTLRANALKLRLVAVRNLALSDRNDYPEHLKEDPRLPRPNFDVPCARCGRHGGTYHHRTHPDGDIVCEGCVKYESKEYRGMSPCQYVYAKKR